MTVEAAARLLELPADATPEQSEARFHELRAKLEDKIAKAPTPGLKAKYRETLDEITLAFETLALASDSSSLPVLQKQRTDDGGPRTAGGAATPPRGSDSANPKSGTERSDILIRNRKSGKEFALVAIIAVAVLAGGGWFILKTRAENAEKARFAAEAKAEADRKAVAEKAEQERKAEEAWLAADAKRKAEEEEKARLAAAEKAEQLRLEKLHAQTNAELVNLRIAWEAVETELRKSERRLAELRSEERDLARGGSNAPEVLRLRAEMGAQASYHEWLETQVGRHEAKILRGQAEAMIAARQYDEAARMVAQAAAAQATLDREIASTRSQLLTLTGTLQVDIKPAQAEWTLTDAYGVKHNGRGAAELKDLPWGPLVLEASFPGYAVKRMEGALSRGKPGILAHEFKPAIVRIDSVPQGAQVNLGGQSFGTTPATIEWPGDGEQSVTLTTRGHRPITRTLSLSSGETADLGAIVLEAYTRGVTRPDFDRGPLRYQITREYRSNSRTSDGAIESASSTNMEFQHRVEIESPTGSSADANRVRYTTLRNHLDGKPSITAGTIQDYTKVKDGWLMNFTLGGFADPAMRPHQKSTVYKASPIGRRTNADLPEWWPGEETFPGDTWDVPISAMKGGGIISFFDDDQKGTITGKVIALRREEGRDVADVEFTIDVSSAHRTNEAVSRYHHAGRLACTVDLTRHFILSESFTLEGTDTIELTSSPDYKRTTKSTIVGSASVRPL